MVSSKLTDLPGRPGLSSGSIVAVVYILVSEADLEDACHDDFRKTVTHQIGSPIPEVPTLLNEVHRLFSDWRIMED